MIKEARSKRRTGQSNKISNHQPDAVSQRSGKPQANASEYSRRDFDVASNGARSNNRNSKGFDHLSKAGESMIAGQQVRRINQNKLLVYEDPALALNLSDDKWNDIVQQNLKNFNEEKRVAKENARINNLKVYEEQKRQMAEKTHKSSIEKNSEMDYFRNVGVRASDVFYVN